MSLHDSASTSLSSADVHRAAQQLRGLAAPIREALGVSTTALQRAAAGAAPAASASLRGRDGVVHQAVEAHLTSLSRLADALDTATDELIAQDTAMVRSAANRAMSAGGRP